MLRAAITEVMQSVLPAYSRYEFPEVVKRYYDENIQMPYFPWNGFAILRIEDTSSVLKYPNTPGGDQHSY